MSRFDKKNFSFGSDQPFLHILTLLSLQNATFAYAKEWKWKLKIEKAGLFQICFIVFIGIVPLPVAEKFNMMSLN